MEKHALITGAAGGLGQAAARRLHKAGWRLVLVSRSRERLADLTESPPALHVTCDVSTVEGAEDALTACFNEFGQPPEALAHCAGTTWLGPLHRTEPEQYRQCITANLDSAFYTLRAFVRRLLDAKAPGSAVLVSSVAARIGVTNHEAIAAAKAGTEGLARSAAATYAARGIRVNAIAPGLMRSPATERLFAPATAEEQISAQYPLGRYGSVDDGAAAIAWLLGDEAKWVTGQTLCVDGGFSSIRPMLRV